MKLSSSLKGREFIIFAIIFAFLISTIIPIKNLKKEKEDTISDAELDVMLKDPKYKDLIGGNVDELLKASPENKKHSKDTASDDFSSKDSSSAEKEEKKKEEKLEDKFATYDFITKQQARYLIEILKQPFFFNMLPSEAQQIVKVTKDNFQFKMTQDGKIDQFIETNLVNTPTSQTFVDPDGQIGRKGTLTIIDPINSTSKFTWTILNSKTLTFFESQSFLTIIKLYRNSSLLLKDIPATPCFMTSNSLSEKEGSLLVCANNTQEKEVWLQTIQSSVKAMQTSNHSFIGNQINKNLKPK